jgi:hypothetical protein
MFLKKRESEQNYYNELQERTLERLEQLCGKTWTDYNIHDPGITIADYFNYALFELKYRLEFPFESYLLEPNRKDVLFAHKGLLPKEELFTGSIVTEYDYERLFISYHPVIKKCVVRLNIKTRLYDIFIMPNGTVSASETATAELIEDIKRLYHKNRNLCENIGEVTRDFDRLRDAKLYQKEKPFRKELYEFPEFDVTPVEEKEIRPYSDKYHSIQLDFPENYGIGERGLPARSTYSDEAKILQLKAYLLIFDFLIADTLQQAGDITDLLDFSELIPKNTIPEVIIPEGSRIVDTDLKSHSRLREDIYHHQQKGAYFNSLDIFYGEDTHNIFSSKDTSHADVNEKRAKLIRSLPQLNASRFLSFNINYANSTASIQQMMESITNFHYESTEVDTFSKYGLRIISDEEFFEKYRFLQNMAFSIDINENAHLLDVEEIDVVYEDRSFHRLRMNINLLWYNVLFKSFLQYGDISRHYKILCLPDNEYLLVFKHPEKSEWINMGLFFNSKEKLTEMANLFWQFIRKIKDKEVHSCFYFVEHILLDHGNMDDKDKLSVIMPDEIKAKERQEVENILFERLPIHLEVIVFYVSREQMHQFEHVYANWRKALASHNREDANYSSIAVRAFLSRHINHSKPL